MTQREKNNGEAKAVTDSSSTSGQKQKKKNQHSCKDDCESKQRVPKDGLHVHSFTGGDQVKVSCQSCIAGHRSGSCSHYSRVLLKVKPAGRPSGVCQHPKVQCGGECIKSHAYVVPDACPHWCYEHKSCILNWVYAEDPPEHPVVTKRKERAKSPAAPLPEKGKDDAASGSEEQQPPGPTNLGRPPTRSSGCCSSKTDPTSSSSTQSIIDSMPAPPMMTVGNSMSGSQYLNANATLPLPALPQIPAFTSGYHPTANYILNDIPGYSMKYNIPSLGPSADSYSITPSLPPSDSSLYASSSSCTQDTSTPYSTPYTTTTTTSTRHPSSTSPPPPKRQCPGSGFQCPCEPGRCICEKCFTHNRGLESPISGFGYASNSQEPPQLPPRELSAEPPHGEQWDFWRDPQEPFGLWGEGGGFEGALPGAYDPELGDGTDWNGIGDVDRGGLDGIWDGIGEGEGYEDWNGDFVATSATAGSRDVAVDSAVDEALGARTAVHLEEEGLDECALWDVQPPTASAPAATSLPMAEEMAQEGDVSEEDPFLTWMYQYLLDDGY